MRKGGGKPKGNSYERWACRKLSLWITEGEDDDVLWRSASSGAMATQRGKRGKGSKQHGDIASVSAEGNSFIESYYLECKHLSDLHTAHIVFGKALKSESSLYNIWLDTKEKAIKVNKLPIIIGRQNNMGDIICLTHATTYSFFARSRKRIPRYMTIRNYKADLCIFPFDEFLIKAEYNESNHSQ